MKRITKAITICLLFAVLIILTGCAQKDLYPNPDILVSISEFNITPSGSNDLPTTSLSFKALNGVTCTLVSYSVVYRSYLHEEIPQLALKDLPINIQIPGADWSSSRSDGEEVTSDFQIYTSRVRDLFAVTQSDISPITAEITLTYKDVNKNTGTVSVSCLLYKYAEESSDDNNNSNNDS